MPMHIPSLSFTVQCIDPVVLRVQDLERSVAFFHNLLACEEGHNIDIPCSRTGPFNEALTIDFLEARTVARSSKAQINFGAESAGPTTHLVDPYGNVIELKRPPCAVFASLILVALVAVPGRFASYI